MGYKGLDSSNGRGLGVEGRYKEQVGLVFGTSVTGKREVETEVGSDSGFFEWDV